MPPKKTRAAAAKAAKALEADSASKKKPAKTAKAPAKPRQRKTTTAKGSPIARGKKGSVAGTKSSGIPQSEAAPPKTAAQSKTQNSKTPETIDLTSDGSNKGAQQNAANGPLTSAPATTSAPQATLAVPATPGVPPSSLLGAGIQLIDEHQASIRFGHRSIPWEFEARRWRQWHDSRTITFHDQQFIVGANHAGTGEASGDCLFRAIARLLTGTGGHHLFVRAEHEQFWKTYDEANQDLFLILGPQAAQDNYEALSVLNRLPGAGQPTLKERLARGGTWQHLEILELTALLYRVQVIVFDDSARPGNAAEDQIGHRPPAEVTVRSFGSRNRTQLLLRFTGPRGGNHFQPMFADVDRPEEYRCGLLDHLDVRDPLRHFQYRSSQSRKGPPSEVPLPFVWRPPPVLKVGDVASLTGRAVVTLSTKPVRNN